MIVYTVVLLVTALLFGTVAARIYKGKIELIHDYHRTRVTDKSGYGKAFGKALAVIAVAMALSGGVSLFGEKTMWAAVAILLAGIAAGTVAIVRAQKKYNGGIFD